MVEGCWYKSKGEYQHGRKNCTYIERDVRVSVDCTDEKITGSCVKKSFSENEADKQEISNNDFFANDFWMLSGLKGVRKEQYSIIGSLWNIYFQKMNQSVRRITTEEIRTYLSDYQKINRCSNVTIDNIRRNISSFFSWLEEEDYILKSPMKRIHKIKTKTVVKSVITDEGIEKSSR